MEDTTLKCGECGSYLPQGFRKYCSHKCRHRAIDRRRKRVRHRNEYYKEWRRKKYQMGLCSICGHENPEHDHYKTCPECRDRARLY